MPYFTPFESSYVAAMLWSSCDENGTPLDDSRYADAVFSPEAARRIKTDCEAFRRLCSVLVDPDSREYHIAHDFWLTRNRHGAGFWDGDYPEPLASHLTSIAHAFGECYPSIDGDLVYID